MIYQVKTFRNGEDWSTRWFEDKIEAEKYRDGNTEYLGHGITMSARMYEYSKEDFSKLTFGQLEGLTVGEFLRMTKGV